MSSPRCSQIDLRKSVHKFVVAGASDELTEELWTDFERLLREDDDACRLYVEYVGISVLLPSILSSIPDEESSFFAAFSRDEQAAFPSHTGFLGNLWHGTVAYFSQVGPLSYLIATVLFGLGLLIGSRIAVEHPVQVVQRSVPQAVEKSAATTESPSVGEITGMADCVWVDRATETFEHDGVPLGRRYGLASGFLEITYDTGAKVILQGPARYEVESVHGGFLSLGKLTARVEKKGSGDRGHGSGSKGERTANLTFSQGEGEPTTSLAPRPSARDPQHYPLSTIHYPLFSVRTPTAVVTDLGTEFGVEVDGSGSTKSRVFQGRIQLRPIGDEGLSFPERGTVADGDIRVVELGENESATVEAGRTGRVNVIRGANQSSVPTFTRQMPKWSAINVFSTGAGLTEGDPDPHWELVARGDDPHFKPRAAVVTVAAPVYLPNDPSRSQWLSTAGNLPPEPGVRFLFRTTFELAEASPDAIVLRGRFIADNSVSAMRINGKSVSVPKHRCNAPFDEFSPFSVSSGFVKGTNVLEIEVSNFASTINPGGPNPDGAAGGIERFPASRIASSRRNC